METKSLQKNHGGRRKGAGLYVSILIGGVFLCIGGLTGGPEFALALGFAASWAIMAVGYDVFSGTSGRINMGFAMFPGVAAYVSAIFNKAGLSPWLSAPAGIASAVALAAVLASVTLRLQGKYFALTTSVVPLVLFQAVIIFSHLTGGEEGMSGVAPFFQDPNTDLVFAMVLLTLCTMFGVWFARSKTGLLLSAIKDSELSARALGVDSFRVLFVGILISAAVGGVGGIYFGHYQMYVGPDLLFIIATLQIVTFCQIGGPGTIIGPVLGSLLLIFLNTFLREFSEIRLLLYFSGLVLLLRFFPDGLFPALLRTIRRFARQRLPALRIAPVEYKQ